MTPIYAIKANGSDITALIRQRLILLEVTDETGFQSDRATIELDDRGNPFKLPAKGAELDIKMGYEKDGKRHLVHMGAFVVDEINITGPPDRLVIEAKAANMTATLKEKKTRPWDNVTLSDIVATIAGEHNLAPVVGSDLAGIRFDHLDQTEESDMHFLTRLGREHDAVAKPISRRLLMVKKGRAKTATGKSLPTVNLTRSDFITPGWDMQSPDRGRYKSVTAFYQDTRAGEKKPVTIGSGKPNAMIRTPFSTQARAEQAARSRLDRLDRGTATLRGSVSARTDMFAEGKINVSGIRSGVNGSWIMTKVTTKIHDNGLTVSFNAEVPKT
ncbi:MAG: hypothetical protein MI863_02705 [Desulfobacterales bacterium]|nr:hypothetical protein [Desulfobacterales bacterium]